MAMQQSPKGAASGSGPNPTLTDDQADQFAASFTPAWDSEDGAGAAEAGSPAEAAPSKDEAFSKTVQQISPQAAAAVAAATAPAAAPVVPFNAKQTLIGAVAPPANPPPAPAPAPVAVAAPAPPLAGGKGATMMMGVAAVPAATPEGRWQEKPSTRPPPQAPAPMRAAANAPRAVSADPFRKPRVESSPGLDDFVPKKSSKTALMVVAGLAIAGGLGLFLRFALSDDSPKAPSAQVATGPAATTAEIPSPPPKVESDTPPTATVAAAPPAPKPEPLPAATSLATAPLRTPAPPDPPARVEQPHPRQPRAAVAPPPPPPVAAPPAAAAPKTPPKPPERGIVRDNPF
jgi:hypothetical protein